MYLGREAGWVSRGLRKLLTALFWRWKGLLRDEFRVHCIQGSWFSVGVLEFWGFTFIMGIYLSSTQVQYSPSVQLELVAATHT